MSRRPRGHPETRLAAALGSLASDAQERARIAGLLRALVKYDLPSKIEREPGVAEIIQQLLGRILGAFGRLSAVEGKRILDIACGSNTSRAPTAVYINTPFGEKTIRRKRDGYTAQFEPWLCRMLFELGANPVGVDLGDLEGEPFEHYKLDLGKRGALDIFPSHSFDAVQDSRLFGSPEFTAQFPAPADRLSIAREIRRQEQRLLKPGGVVIHSDAEELLKQE